MALTTKQVKDLNRACEPLNNVLLGTWLNSSGSYAVIGTEESGSTCTVAPGIALIHGWSVQIMRGGAVATSDAAISSSGSRLTIADGSTYNLTTGDIIYYHVW